MQQKKIKFNGIQLVFKAYSNRLHLPIQFSKVNIFYNAKPQPQSWERRKLFCLNTAIACSIKSHVCIYCEWCVNWKLPINRSKWWKYTPQLRIAFHCTHKHLLKDTSHRFEEGEENAIDVGKVNAVHSFINNQLARQWNVDAKPSVKSIEQKAQIVEKRTKREPRRKDERQGIA